MVAIPQGSFYSNLLDARDSVDHAQSNLGQHEFNPLRFSQSTFFALDPKYYLVVKAIRGNHSKQTRVNFFGL